MTTSIHWRTTATRLALAAAGIVFVAALASNAGAGGVTREQLEAHGWTCFVPPPLPDEVACFDPGRGRPVPGNADPAPSYSTLRFSRVSGEFLSTVHLIRHDLYSGQPCGKEQYVFIPVIGYWECVHR
jgi:hypothetical protein